MSILTLHTTGKPNAEFKPKCTIQMEKTIEVYDDFVMVAMEPKTGQVNYRMFTDPITLGFAIQLMKKSFDDYMAGLNNKDRVAIINILQGGLGQGGIILE